MAKKGLFCIKIGNFLEAISSITKLFYYILKFNINR